MNVDLADPYPDFLLKLDTDRQSAIEAFRAFVDELFSSAPPSNYYQIPIDEREDFVSEVFVHCIDDDCANLRKYEPRSGALFAGWLAVVASRKISDLLKRERRKGDIFTLDETNEPPTISPDPEQIAIESDLERLFLSALKQLKDRCRLLLRLRLLEYKNREIVQILRLPKKQNKIIGNQVIECRKKLAKLLRGIGFFDHAHGNRKTT